MVPKRTHANTFALLIHLDMTEDSWAQSLKEEKSHIREKSGKTVLIYSFIVFSKDFLIICYVPEMF